MNLNRMIGIILIIAGLIAVIYGYNKKQEASIVLAITERKDEGIKDNLGKKELEVGMNQNGGDVRMLFIGGSILILIGGALLVFGRSKK
jgi:hypothetical protein